MAATANSSERFDIEAMQLQATKASRLLGAMCNETRLMLLCQLVDEERSVNQLADLLGVAQSTVSQHLALLRREGFVRSRREAQAQYYSLAGDEARAILEALQVLYCGPQARDA